MNGYEPAERSKAFMAHLYKEKEIHKEHRHRHVIHKLLLTSSFFGLGQIAQASQPGQSSAITPLWLYAVPLIAVVHDIYIFAEHDKISRVGNFIRGFEEVGNSAVCPEEIYWEVFAGRNREHQAVIGSLIYTLTISLFAALAICKLNPRATDDIMFQIWAVVVAMAVIAVFIRGRFTINVRVTSKYRPEKSTEP